MKTLLFLLFPLSLFAQKTTTGIVTDFRTNEPLIGATLTLQSDPSKGTQTDIDGTFSINILSENDSLIISYIGYKIRKSAAKKDMTIRLRTDDNLIKEVVVKADKLIAREFTTARIEKLDIYLNPNSKADALRAVDALPASTNTEESANISLRGSSPAETGIFLNNVPLDDVVRFDQTNGVGQFSIFNTAMIESVNIFPSNPPVEFGNATAGVVALYTDENIPDKSNSLSINLVGISGLMSRNISTKTGIVAYANWNTHKALEFLNPTAFDNLNSFRTADAGLYIIHKFSDKTTFKVFNFSLSEGYDFALKHPSFSGNFEQKKWRNLSVANLVHKRDKSRWEWNQSFNISKASYAGGNIDINEHNFDWYQALQGLYFTDKFSLKGGLSAKMDKVTSNGQFSSYSYALAPEQPATNFDQTDILFVPEAFIYGKCNLSKKWILGGGLRAHPRTNDEPAYLNAQANANWRFAKGHSFTFAGGQYRKVQIAEGDNTRSLLKSQQISIDYKWFNENWTIQAATYLKDNTQGIIQNPIRGVEFFTSYKKGNFTGSVSLASIQSLIKSDEISYPSDYDLSYYLRAYIKYDIPNLFTLGLIYKQRQGRYYLPVLNASFDQNTQAYAPIYLAQNEGQRLPEYRLLDISLTKILPVSFGSIILYANANNLLNTENIRGYLYNADYSQNTPDYFGRRVIFFGALLQW